MKNHGIVLVALVASVASLLAGCGHSDGRICVARSHGTCTKDEPHPTAAEQSREDVDRAAASREGRPYHPPMYPDETPSQHLARRQEEDDRHEAESHGRSYAPQRRGESASEWFKRASKQQSSPSFGSGSSGFGSGASSSSPFGGSGRP